MKKILMAVLLVAIVATMCACSKVAAVTEPDVELQLNISNITDEQYEEIGTMDFENPTKEDFLNFEFILNVNSDEISDEDVTIPEIKKIVNEYDDIERYWYGQSTKENTRYSNESVIYTKGLDRQGIKNMFSTADVKIIFKDGEKTYNLGEALQFK